MVLFVAGILTAILGDWLDATFVFLAVFINVGLGFFQEYRAEHTLETLSSYMKERSRVLRDGKEIEIDSTDLVPGDVVRLTYGVRVPADGRIVSVNNLAVDESLLTGESLAIEKSIGVVSVATSLAERVNMVFAGTMVIDGYGTMVVSHTGSQTELGSIARLVSRVEKSMTPLQKSVSLLAWIIFWAVSVIVIGVFFLGVSRGEPLMDMLILSIAVAVGSVPEALPIALTVILAVGAERLARKGGVVRSLSAVETLGSTNIIMVDKTGTLTQADMKLVDVYSLSEIVRAPSLLESASGMTPEKRHILIESFSSTDVIVENPQDTPTAWRFVGRPVEVGIARALFADATLAPHMLMEKRKTPLLPFNSAHKFSVAESVQGSGLVVMGAPDILLERSRISDTARSAVHTWIEKVSNDGMRLIGIGHFQSATENRMYPRDVHDIRFVGVLVFKDPLRSDTRASVERIQSFGTRVIMLTGDIKGTAIAVARELGWSIEPDEVITGQEIRLLDDETLVALLDRLKICARMTPEDKLRVGMLLKKVGYVVAMTGDGVNDAPSLRAVDIGVALGSGSDVAKSVADLVLLTDSFSVIVSAIEEGRRVLVNIRKTFVYLMSNALDEVFLIGGSLVFALPLPLTALQIIWVNVFTGSLPALALAFDANNDADTHHKDTRMLNKEVTFLTIITGILTSTFLFLLYAGLIHLGFHIDEARTILFVCFASYILVISYSFRSLRKTLFTFPTLNNRYLNMSIIISALLIIVTISVPQIRVLFDLVVPPPIFYGIVPIWFVLNIGIVELSKWFVRRLVQK